MIQKLKGKATWIVTGDVDYHSAIDAVAQGIAVIDAGHYGTEYGFIAYGEISEPKHVSELR